MISKEESRRIHLDWWQKCRSCIFWTGADAGDGSGIGPKNQPRWHPGLCTNPASDLYQHETWTEGHCPQWDSFDIDTALEMLQESADTEAYEKWERETYPRLWRSAYQLGEEARKNNLPRTCNLDGAEHCHNGVPLKPYRSAWEQGWDAYQMPAEFTQVEAALKQMPLRPLRSEDI